MFFEDEKDIIKEGTEIRVDDDGTVTWEDVLSSDEELASYDEVTASSNDNVKNLGDELQLVEEEDEDVDDQELIEILNNSSSSESTSNSSSSYKPTSDSSDEDFDIDKQLANVVSEQNGNIGNDGVTPRKMEQKKKSSSNMPFLLLILFVLLAGGGAYYYFTMFADNENLNQETIPRPTTYQEQVTENLNQDVLQQRQPDENIPVVNEEEAGSVEAANKEEEKEEVKKEEKKQVINVIPTGRSNPFLPIAKYATSEVETKSAEIDFGLTDIPRPPEEYGIQEETEKLMSIAVSGIMYDDTKPSAIITYDNNDYFVQKGDMLDQYKIIDIGRNFVTILSGTNVYKANIGEEFKIGSDFYGSAKFVPEQKGNVRHYQSVSADKGNTQNRQTTRYVSEDDITINAR